MYSSRKCVFCGKAFTPKNSRQQTCGDQHYSRCPDCGTLVLIKDTSYSNFVKNGPRRCEKCRKTSISNSRRNMDVESKKNMLNKMKKTSLEKYGVENVSQLDAVKEKRLKTVQEKYGVESNISQSKDIQEKIRQNSREKYGVDHYSNSPEIRERMKQGMVEKYGVDNPQKVDEIKEKTRQTNLDKYGVENVFQSAEVKEKSKKTCLEKYGAEYCMQNSDISEKARKTNLERYGSVNYIQSNEYLESVILDGSKIEEYRKFVSDPEYYIKTNFESRPTAKQVAEKIGVSDTTVYAYLPVNSTSSCLKKCISSTEDEIYEFLCEVVPDTKIVRNDRNIIFPKELDFYLPEYKFAIECNSTYTHNSTLPDPWGGLPKSINYHRNKSIACQEKGTFLFHLFGYEWTNKKEIIKSMIQNSLRKSENVIYGRDTHVCEISQLELSEFLNKNHRQGAITAKIRLGLKRNDSEELVSVMCFSKLRTGLGKKQDSGENDIELSRFCSLLNTNVVGGASKLFKHFVENYEFNKIVSFSDVAHTKGNLYQILGFNKVSVSDPDYVWVDPKTDRYYNRVTCQKRNLPKLLSESSLDIENSSESQIMEQHGFVRVYDCGVIRWEYSGQELQKKNET